MEKREPSHDAWVRGVVAAQGPALLRYARSITHDEERARDAVQETFVRLLRAERAQIETYLKPWLYRVCRTRALDILRKERRTEPMDDQALQAAPDDQRGPGETADTNDSLQVILRLIDKLPPAQREVLRLKFQNDLSYKEIAEITARSVNAVGVLIHDAMVNLRARLQNETDLLAG